MHLLFETALGYALFKVDEKNFEKIKSWEDLPQDYNKVNSLLKLQAFKEFSDAKEVLRASVKAIHGKMSKTLQKFLKQNKITKELQAKLLVGDKKMAVEISKKLGLTCENNDNVTELTRLIRMNVDKILGNVNHDEIKNMALGLAHGLGRFRIKFSSEKVDTMIIQAVSLHEDLDKEINNYMMRLKEWYGYHFPELTKVVSDNILYTKVVSELGLKSNYENVDLSEIVGEDVEKEIKSAAEMSMGTEITENDLLFIRGLTEQILELNSYRESLEDYLKNRMMTVAPNLSVVVGEIIAAKLISKAGSLINLAKASASTIQIMGAEKALFKALRNKKKTPKYGIIYQTKIVSNTNGRAKAKIARALAAKSALCVRYDALAEDENTNTLGMKSRDYLEKRIEYLDKDENKGFSKKKDFVKDFGNKTLKKNYNNKGDVLLTKRDNSKDNFKGTFKKTKQN
jgi:nucleolar protein 58